jgi:Spy/CpxP family protein refolding chaperone
MRATWIVVLATTIVVVLGAPAGAGMMGQMQHSGQAGGMGAGATGEMRGGERMGPGDRMMGHEGPLLTMMLSHSQDLGLSPEQEQKLRALRTAFAKEAVRRTAEIRVAQIDLEALLEQERWDLAQIEPTVKQVAALEGDLRVARIKTLAAGRALLTSQQLEKLKQVGHHMRSMGGPGGMGHGMMGPGSPAAPGTNVPGGPPAQPHRH